MNRNINNNKNIQNLASRRFLARTSINSDNTNNQEINDCDMSNKNKINIKNKYTSYSFLNYYIITLMYILFSIKIE